MFKRLYVIFQRIKEIHPDATSLSVNDSGAYFWTGNKGWVFQDFTTNSRTRELLLKAFRIWDRWGEKWEKNTIV